MATKGSSKQRGGAAALWEEPPPASTEFAPTGAVRTDAAETAVSRVSAPLEAPQAAEVALSPTPQAAAGAVSGSTDPKASGTRQFVTFLSGDEVFAVDMEPVKEIIRVPSVVRVPLAPASLDGLANLRGKVLPIVSLRHLFGFASQEHTEQTRALVVDVGQPLGFVVDRVASVVGVEASRIEDVESIRTTVDTELLSGLIKNVGDHPMIMILDFARIIEREFSSIAQLAKGSGGALGARAAVVEASKEGATDELQLVSFDLDGQEYAIAIQDVHEIVQVPEEIVHVPRAESHVLGVMTLRSRLLPLVGLRHMFGLDHRPLDEKSRIVVLALDGASVGVVVDAVREVLRVPKSVVEPLPALLVREGNLNEIAEICRLNDGRRLVSIVTVRQLFRQAAIREGIPEEIREALEGMNEAAAKSATEVAGGAEKLDDDEQVVVFRLDKEEFGAPIASVQEIVRVPEPLIRVPKAPGFVEGVINLRGSVLPVIDLRTRLGLPPVERSDRQRIMVFLISGVRTGFIVDQVAEVLRIPKASIEPAPELSGDQSLLLSRMANLGQQKRMVQLLDPPHLMGQKDLAALARVAN